MEPSRWGTPRESATLTVRWFAAKTSDVPPEFSFHYSDSDADFAWHHHEQKHVGGWGHFQERTSGSGYTYEPYQFPSQNPAQLTWEVMADLASKLPSK